MIFSNGCPCTAHPIATVADDAEQEYQKSAIHWLSEAVGDLPVLATACANLASSL